jgi:hypothetical protein
LSNLAFLVGLSIVGSADGVAKGAAVAVKDMVLWEPVSLGPTAVDKHPACFDTKAGERTLAPAAMLSNG